MAANCKDDLRGRNGRWCGFLHPHLVVMECGAADRRNRLGAGERIDPSTPDVSAIRMNRFRDQHAATQTIEYFCGQRRLAARIAQGDGVAVGVSLKLELRKPRDGLVASRNGCASSASSMIVQWSGSDGIFCQGPIPAMPQGGCAQSALKWNFLSACAKPSR